MKENKKTILQNYFKGCMDLTEYFIKKYFGNIKDVDYYFIGDEIGTVCFINDYFFNMENMVDYLRYSYSVDDMFKHNEYALKCHEKGDLPICIRDYKKIKKQD